MAEFTKERLQQIVHAAGLEPCDYEQVFDSITTGEIVMMARQLLASLEQEPVAYMVGDYSLLHYQDPKVEEYLDRATPLYAAPQLPQPVEADSEIYAELYRLRAEIKGPEGFDTWKDAAISEKKARIACEKRIPEIDYLTAMGAYHSDDWHKMGTITGYMRGWNACRAAMLQGDHRDLSYPVDPQVAEFEKIMQQAVPEGWKLVPLIAFPSQWAAGQKAFEAAGMNKVDAVYKAMVAAAPQQEAE